MMYLVCKKCGGSRHRLIRYGTEGVVVSCPECGYCTKKKATAEEAVKAWNTRTKNKEEKTMKIVSIKAQKVYAGPGMWAFAAEAEVDTGADELTFVTINDYDGAECTVAGKSVMAFLTGAAEEPVEEFSEEYTSLKEAQEKSAYGDVFVKLHKAIGMLG